MDKLLMLKNKAMMAPVVLSGINEGELEKWIKSYTDPITNLLIWLIPIGGVIASLVTIVVWFTKDEEMKQRDNPYRIVKKIVFLVSCRRRYACHLQSIRNYIIK